MSGFDYQSSIEDSPGESLYPSQKMSREEFPMRGQGRSSLSETDRRKMGVLQVAEPGWWVERDTFAYVIPHPDAILLKFVIRGLLRSEGHPRNRPIVGPYMITDEGRRRLAEYRMAVDTKTPL